MSLPGEVGVAWLIVMGVMSGGAERPEIDKILVEANFQDATDLVARLVGLIAVDTARPEPPNPHFARCLGDQFKGYLVAIVAGEVLVHFVGWAGVSTVHE